jgi:predicted small secreted protein
MFARLISAATATFLLGLTAVVMSGCYTVEGVGRDVSAAGAGVADVAEDARPYDAPR